VKRLSSLLSKTSVGILHTHLYDSSLIGVASKWMRRKTIVAVMRHHTGVVRLLGSRAHIFADKWMAEHADHLTTVSEAAKEYMVRIDGVRRKDIEVVYTGFDFEKLAPNAEGRHRVRHEFGFSDNDLVIGYVGNMIPGKGHLELVKAFGEMVSSFPNLRLFLIGRGSLEEVKAAAAACGDGRVVFAGWRDDSSACMNAMDLFVQPSLSEAFSQVLVEAMAVGLPVIATSVGGAKEVIKDGENGLLIDAGHPHEIANAAANLLNDEELRSRLAANGMNSVRQCFTVDNMADRLLELYEKWLGERDKTKNAI